MYSNVTKSEASVINLKCIIEGANVELPVVSARIDVGINQSSTASIEIPPLIEALDIKPRSVIALFFDREAFDGKPNGKDSPWELIFIGQVLSYSSVKARSYRNFTIQCADFYNFLSSIYIYQTNWDPNNPDVGYDFSSLEGGVSASPPSSDIINGIVITDTCASKGISVDGAAAPVDANGTSYSTSITAPSNNVNDFPPHPVVWKYETKIPFTLHAKEAKAKEYFTKLYEKSKELGADQLIYDNNKTTGTSDAVMFTAAKLKALTPLTPKSQDASGVLDVTQGIPPVFNPDAIYIPVNSEVNSGNNGTGSLAVTAVTRSNQNRVGSSTNSGVAPSLYCYILSIQEELQKTVSSTDKLKIQAVPCEYDQETGQAFIPDDTDIIDITCFQSQPWTVTKSCLNIFSKGPPKIGATGNNNYTDFYAGEAFLFVNTEYLTNYRYGGERERLRIKRLTREDASCGILGKGEVPVDQFDRKAVLLEKLVYRANNSTSPSSKIWTKEFDSLIGWEVLIPYQRRDKQSFTNILGLSLAPDTYDIVNVIITSASVGGIEADAFLEIEPANSFSTQLPSEAWGLGRTVIFYFAKSYLEGLDPLITIPKDTSSLEDYESLYSVTQDVVIKNIEQATSLTFSSIPITDTTIRNKKLEDAGFTEQFMSSGNSLRIGFRSLGSDKSIKIDNNIVSIEVFMELGNWEAKRGDFTNNGIYTNYFNSLIQTTPQIGQALSLATKQWVLSAANVQEGTGITILSLLKDSFNETAASGEINVRDSMILFINKLKQNYLMNPYLIFESLRTKLLDQIEGIDKDPLPSEVLSSYYLEVLISEIPQFLGRYVSMAEIIQWLFPRIYYNYVSNPTAVFTNNKLASMLFLPKLNFSDPPDCNIIKQEDYFDFSYESHALTEITRLGVFVVDRIVEEMGNGVVPRLLKPSIIAPTPIFMPGQTIVDDESGTKTVHPHEYFTGIVPDFMDISNLRASAMADIMANSYNSPKKIGEEGANIPYDATIPANAGELFSVAQALIDGKPAWYVDCIKYGYTTSLAPLYPEFRTRIEALLAAAAQAGFPFSITYSLRVVWFQKYLRAKIGTGASGKTFNAPHVLGVATDIWPTDTKNNNSNGQGPGWRWKKNNERSFGLRPVSFEQTHIELADKWPDRYWRKNTSGFEYYPEIYDADSIPSWAYTKSGGLTELRGKAGTNKPPYK